MNIFVWNSAATSVTGPKIKEALAEKYGPNNVVLTREHPPAERGDVVLAYGAKTREPVRFAPGVHVINHPDAIRTNRNKFEALKKMGEDVDVNVPGYGAIEEMTDAGIKSIIDITGVAVARSKYHQMGRGLYLCMTVDDVRKAHHRGAYYVQVYKPVKSEYRLHVNFNEVLVASRKELIDDPHEAWKAAYKEKVLNRFDEGVNVDEELLDKALTIIAKDINLPDFMVRSHKHGWKFKRLNIDNVSDELKDMAVAAVKSIGLDFGAVDCALDVDGKPFIIEVNSGAGLEGRAFEKFVASVCSHIDSINAPEIEPAPAAVHEAHEAHEAAAVKERLPIIDDNNVNRRIDGLVEIVNNLVKSQEDIARALAQIAANG